MKTRIKILAGYWLGWVLFFELARLVFVLANHTLVNEANRGEIFASFWHGLRMDFSMAAYLTLPIAVFLVLSTFVSVFRFRTIYISYTFIIFFCILLLVFADIGLFKAWGFRIDNTPLRYLSSPREVWASVSHLPITFIIILFFGCLWVGYAFVKITWRTTWPLPVLRGSRTWQVALLLLLMGATLVIPLRGGLQLAPLNQSSVYFADDNFANMAALNAPWNFIHAITHSAGSKNPFTLQDTTRLKDVREDLFRQSATTNYIVDTSRRTPLNLVMIVWESFTSKAIGLALDGKEVSPGFNKLIQEGIYFSDIYATGDRTDKGLVAVLSGYPAQPTTSIIKEPSKVNKLASLPKVLNKEGYHTAFYYGGELEFANIKAYLMQGGIHRFITINDFARKDQNSKWGAHDAVVAQRLLADLGNAQHPFFYTWLTLSSHEPYEVPGKKYFSGNDDASQFLNSMHYSDAVVASFISAAKTKPWWSNTLIVVVADHGHRLPVNTDRTQDFKIPVLFLGGALQSSPAVVNAIGSQTGLPATILAQMKLATTNFTWSRNWLDSAYRPWSLFSFNNGFGYVTPQKKLVYDNVGKQLIEASKNVDSADIITGRQLQYIFFQDYLSR